MKFRITSIAVIVMLAMSAALFAEDKTAPSSPADLKAGVAVATLGQQAPDFKLMDSDNKEHKLSDYKGKYVVLEWVNYDCPFVKKHYSVENMQGLQTSYAEKEVAWLSICSSAKGKQGHFEGDDLKLRIKEEKSAATAYLVDADGTVGRMYEAKTTPHMFIINPEGTLIYAGAIDNIKSTSSADIDGAVNYVQTTLDAAMTDKVIEISSTKSYGCSVKYAK